MSETNFTLDTTLAFDVGKQAAIVGWVLQDKLFAMQCMSAVMPEWFSSPNVVKLYSAVIAIYRQFHRIPTPLELKQYRPFTQEDARSKQKLDDQLVDCLKKTQSYGLDMLRSEMTSWMHAVIFAQSIQKSVILYNAKKVEEAWSIMDQATLVKTTATFEEGTNQGFASSVARILDEREERMEQSKRILRYGVNYLDDSLGGIIPNDLIVLGADSGAGKTQLAVSIALENAPAAKALGQEVFYFALEAENFEIERRIKYGAISNEYYERNKGQDVPIISYGDWRMGRNDDLLGPIERDMGKKLTTSVDGLQTLYRTSGSFNLQALERNLLEVVHKARLIIIDHLHYIDTDGTDENTAYKGVIKLIRDIVLRFGVPIVVIAHLRKKQNARQAPVIPTIQEFHGTSDVPKIATTCIMMSPCFDHVAPEKYLWPTYIGAVKSRLDGSRTRYTGLTHFDSRTSRYTDSYRIGKIADGQWEELRIRLPHWADPSLLDVKTNHALG